MTFNAILHYHNSMNVSITIPQLFYDVIGRILPGYLFVIVLRFELSSTGIMLLPLTQTNNTNFIASLSNGIGFLVCCYFLGIVLRAFVCYSHEKTVKKEILEKYALKVESEKESGGAISMHKMYQYIKLTDPTAGFRLVKLRAEARMIDVSRTGMCIIFILTFLLFFLQSIKAIELPDVSWYIWAGKLILPLILAFAFWRQEKKSWCRYYGNIVSLYPLIKEKDSREEDKPAQDNVKG